MQMNSDSSVYYAVTLVSSDAVWLLSHLPVKKGVSGEGDGLRSECFSHTDCVHSSKK